MQNESDIKYFYNHDDFFCILLKKSLPANHLMKSCHLKLLVWIFTFLIYNTFLQSFFPTNTKTDVVTSALSLV